jgi:hypothetical protein
MYDGADPARGRILLLALITVLLATSALNIAIFLAFTPTSMTSQDRQIAIATRAGRFVLTVLLLSMVYRGSVIARWISITLLALGMLVFVPLALLQPILFVMVFIYGAFAYALLFSVDVLEYLGQRQRSSDH